MSFRHSEGGVWYNGRVMEKAGLWRQDMHHDGSHMHVMCVHGACNQNQLEAQNYEMRCNYNDDSLWHYVLPGS